ncbi:MAG: Spore protein SP21 [Phycisphaerae bacterium]|nr:Spore protein SP21 [Phycisphaerae bacterium]
MPLFDWGGDPWAPLKEMQRELGRLLGRGGGESQLVGGGSYPPVSIYDGEDRMIVLAEVPGVPLSALDLSITDDTLVIKGSKPAPEAARESYHRRERGSGDFSRTVVLPDSVNAEKIKAQLAHGILRIELPKSEASRPRKIDVQSS